MQNRKPRFLMYAFEIISETTVFWSCLGIKQPYAPLHLLIVVVKKPEQRHGEVLEHPGHCHLCWSI